MRIAFTLIVLLVARLGIAAELDATTIRSLSAQACSIWNVPNAITVVVQGNRSFVEGVNSTPSINSESASAETFIPLASCTKAVTVALLAKYVDDGKLSWDDPVHKLVPEFRVGDPHVNALITLRDLVSHRSGIKGHDLLWYKAPWDRDEIFKRIEKLPVERTFRGSYEYSTILFMVAGKAAENVGGKPWAELVHEQLTKPLGMSSVVFSTADPRFSKSGMLKGFRRTKENQLRVVPPYETREPNAAGSIHLAAKDLVPWMRWQLARGAHNGQAIISSNAFDEMHKPLNPIPMDPLLKSLNPDTVQMSYAMGWLVYDYRGCKVVAHGGMIDGYRIQITLFPENDLAIAVVHNVQESRMNQALTNLLADRALNLPVKDWNAILIESVGKDEERRRQEWSAIVKSRRPGVPPSLPLREFAATYIDTAYGDAKVIVEDGRLVWKWSSFAIPLEHWEGDIFRMTSGILEDRFLGFKVGRHGVESFQFEGRTFQKVLP